MPNVVGMDEQEAVAQLEGMGRVVDVKTLPVHTEPPDIVVAQDQAAGTTVRQGQTVTIWVSLPA
jgi:beta-lactam-binding protein with PASTA domain